MSCSLVIALHTCILFLQVITLNVAVNSYSNALLALLMSNQMVEIKGTVFKKFEKENLFQITCADVVERFQLTLLLGIIGLQNFLEFFASSSGSSESPLTTLLSTLWTIAVPTFWVIGSECLVDWMKHAFVTKFNHFRPSIYSRFKDVLCRDYVQSGSNTLSHVNTHDHFANTDQE